MPTFPLGKGAHLTINAVEYSDSAFEEDYATNVEALDNTVHGSSFHKTNQPGLIETEFSVKMRYSQTVYAALRTLLLNRTTHTVIYGPEGSTTGKERMTVAGAFITSLSRPVKVDGIIEFDAEWAVGTTAPAYDTF